MDMQKRREEIQAKKARLEELRQSRLRRESDRTKRQSVGVSAPVAVPDPAPFLVMAASY
jgi:hypothetical protein